MFYFIICINLELVDNQMKNVINLSYTKELEEKTMNENKVEEKSLTEYKERKGFFQWIKSRFEKLKERFSPAKKVDEHQKENQNGPGFTPEDLDVVTAGYPNPSVLDFDEQKAKIDNLVEPKPWELTPEQHEKVEEGYEEIRAESNQDEQELTVEELDEVMAGQPRVDDEYSK